MVSLRRSSTKLLYLIISVKGQRVKDLSQTRWIDFTLILILIEINVSFYRRRKGGLRFNDSSSSVSVLSKVSKDEILGQI